jgi:hypothetical protein
MVCHSTLPYPYQTPQILNTS